MRLDKFLSNMGLGSRHDVHGIIASGSVSIDGIVCKERDAKFDENSSIVTVNGVHIPYKPFVYIMLNKPAGYLSSTDDGSGPVVTDLLGGAYSSYRPGVAGRLDKDAEGLLLLTNDGDYIHKVITPEKHVAKQYFVKLKREITARDVVQFERGIKLADGTQLRPAKLESVSEENVRENGAEEGNTAAGVKCPCAIVTITEGKFHQVKKMFLATDNEVKYLMRLSIGGLRLDGTLRPGEYKELDPEEAKTAYEQADS